jgi:hypothetical protein
MMSSIAFVGCQDLWLTLPLCISSACIRLWITFDTPLTSATTSNPIMWDGKDQSVEFVVAGRSDAEYASDPETVEA